VSTLARRSVTALILTSIIFLTFLFTAEAIGTKIFLIICATLALYEWIKHKPCIHHIYTIHVCIIILSGAFCLYVMPPHILIIVIIIAFAYDTFAYLIGRSYGGTLISRKLFPKTSPNKTWEGLLSGILAAAIIGLAFQVYWPGQPIDKTSRAIIIFGGSLAALGDYVASRYKRTIDIKDSDIHLTESLLPGHGGFIDRFFSLFTVAIGAVVLIFLLL